MAGLIMDPSDIIYIKNVNEDVLRDSLESNVEACDSFTGVGINNCATDFRENKTGDDESCESPQNGCAKMYCGVDKQKKPRTRQNKDTSTVKPKPFKNMVELNKINLKKGQEVNSYSKIHQRKRGKTEPIENHENSTPERTSRTNAAIELRKQLVIDGILTEKDESNMSHKSTEREKYSFDSARSNETNLSLGRELGLSDRSYSNRPNYQNNNYRFVESNTNRTVELNPFENEKISCSTNYQLPPVRPFPTLVQSAPADIQTYLGLSYENSFRSSSHQSLKLCGDNNADLNNSATSLAGTKSLIDQRHSTTYSGIYASTKQNLVTNYKPYTLSDYKKLKKQGTGKPGGLGPDTKSEEHQQKVKKAIRQKEYSVTVKQRNTSESYHDNTKNRHAATTKAVSVQRQEANTRRSKAMEYAKTVPKPVKSKITQNSWKLPSEEMAEKPQTLLAILQQRHEEEKKAIDATRKNFQAKYSG